MEVQALKRCLHFLCAVLERNIMGVAKRKQIIVPEEYDIIPEECRKILEEYRKIPEECRKAHVTISVAASQSQARGYFLFKGWFRLNLAPSLVFSYVKFWKRGTLEKFFSALAWRQRRKIATCAVLLFIYQKQGCKGFVRFVVIRSHSERAALPQKQGCCCFWLPFGYPTK